MICCDVFIGDLVMTKPEYQSLSMELIAQLNKIRHCNPVVDEYFEAVGVIPFRMGLGQVSELNKFREKVLKFDNTQPKFIAVHRQICALLGVNFPVGNWRNDSF